jgi:hypothetical protein
MASRTYATRPDTLTIGNHQYSVEWLTTSEWEARDYPMEKDGLTYAPRQSIVIRLIEDRSESLYQEVVLHEVTHAAWDSVGLGLMEDWHKGEDSHDVEERVVLLQSPVLLRVLKDNPLLVKWLVSDGAMRR